MPDVHDQPDDRAAEAALIERARNGCCESFGKVVGLHQDRLYNFLLRRLRNAQDAEEVAHAALVRAWMNLAKYDSAWRFSTWLYTIALRQAAEMQRRGGRERSTPHLALVREGDPADAIETSDECRAVWALADEVLGDDERVALWMRYGDDSPIEQIAAVLGRTKGATRVMLCRARQQLAAAWHERQGCDRPAVQNPQNSDTKLSQNVPQMQSAGCTGAKR